MGLRDWLFGKAKKPMASLSDVLTGRPPGRRADSGDISKAMRDAFAKRGFQIVSDPETAALGGYTLKTPDGFRPGDMGKLIADVMAQVKSQGIIQSFEEPRPGIFDEPRPGIKPPFHESDDEADRLGWSGWRSTMAEMSDVPGWAPCRFANRIGDERISWVFGIARGDFAVWSQPYPVCHHPHDDAADDKATFEPEAILSAVTHLPSGMGMGIFHDRATACAACELLDGVENWRALPQTEDTIEARMRWKEVMVKANRAWEFNGISWSLDWHAHNGPGGGELGIWTRSPAFLNEGKPEKLS